MTSAAAPYAGWRASAATALVLAGATTAHTWAGGHLPHWSTLALLAAVIQGSGLLVLRGRLSWRLALLAVAVAQAFLHTSFVVTSAHAGHQDAALASSADPWTWQMLVAHAAVTVLTLVVWAGCRRASTVVLRLLVLPRGVSRDEVARPAAHRFPPVRGRLRIGDAPLRGPPTFAAA